MGRHDDLWSLFYMLTEFIIGQLPWRKMKNKEAVGEMKTKQDHAQFLRYLPSELAVFLRHVETLQYYSEPDYAMLADLFVKCMNRKGVSAGDLYDWEVTAATPAAAVVTAAGAAAGQAPARHAGWVGRGREGGRGRLLS